MASVHQSSGIVAANSTTTKTYNFGFTAAAGNKLIAIVHAAASASTPSGWTNHSQTGSSTIGYVFTKTAAGGETSLTFTQNGDRPVGVAVWEFPSTYIYSIATQWFIGTSATASVPVTGIGTYLTFRVGDVSGSTPAVTNWAAGSGTEAVDLQPFSSVDNIIAWTSVYQMDHSASTTLNWQMTGALNGSSLNIHIKEAPAAGASVKLAEYSGAPSTTHTINFTQASVAGSDVLIFGKSGAGATLPSGWVQDHAFLNADYGFVYRLPGSVNTGISSVTLTLSAVRQLVAVVIQDYVAAAGNPSYSNFTTASGNVVAGGTLLGTGVHTYISQDVAFAVFWLSRSVGDTFGTPTLSAVDQSFSIIGQKYINPAGVSEGHLVGLTSLAGSIFNNDGVTATFNPAVSGNNFPSQALPGIIAYTRRTPPAGDTTPPTVITRVPSSGISGVSVFTPITVTFSEVVTAATITLKQTVPNTVVPGVTTGTGNTRTFTPNSALLGSTNYNVTVSDFTDVAGNLQTTPNTWQFTTGSADTVAPTVTSRTPAANTTGVAVNTTVIVGFSETVTAATITVNRSGTNVPGTVTGTGPSRTFTPSSTLLNGTVYTVVVSGAVDAAGNTQVSSDTWDFTTIAADITPPTVSSKTPTANAINIATNTLVTVNFSEAISTVSITMNQAGTNVPGTITGTGATRLFTPSSALQNTKVYTVVVSGAVDLAGNTQVGSDTWSFTTIDPASIPFGATITDEIAFPGDPAPNWSILGAGYIPTLGFVRNFSTNAGNTVQFSVNGPSTQISIYRIGGYNTGWRLLTNIVNTQTTQPAATVPAGWNGGTSCSNWSVTAAWAIPANAWSGLYVGVVRPTAVADASYIPFVVRNDSRTADIVVKTSETTWGMAYNYYGTPGAELSGKCVYGIGGIGNIIDRSFAVSIERPIITRQSIPQTYWMTMEMPLWRFLDKQGFNWKLISSADLDAGLSTTAGAKVLVSSGHDEYWSDGMRNNAEAFRDLGGNLVFFSGNEVFWRIRFDASRKYYWCYKDTMTGPDTHVAGTPLDPVSWTGTWKDNRWVGRKPENTITGTDFRMNGVRDETMTVAAVTYGSSPFWRHTNVATGTNLTVAGIIGMEADSYLPTQTGVNVVRVAATTININGSYADNNGENYGGNGNLDWGIALQLYPSGGVVAGFGTCQWQWGLDPTHDRGPQVDNAQIKQATINLFTDMGAPAANPVAGLVKPTQTPWLSYGLGSPGGPTALTSKFYAGASQAVQVYAGSVKPDKIYLGSTLVWQKEDHP